MMNTQLELPGVEAGGSAVPSFRFYVYDYYQGSFFGADEETARAYAALEDDYAILDTVRGVEIQGAGGEEIPIERIPPLESPKGDGSEGSAVNAPEDDREW
jgi:hypothetical protein